MKMFQAFTIACRVLLPVPVCQNYEISKQHTEDFAWLYYVIDFTMTYYTVLMQKLTTM